MNSEEKGKSICGYKTCKEKATTKGFIFGRFKDDDKPDRVIPINTCDEHARRKDYYPEGELDGIN